MSSHWLRRAILAAAVGLGVWAGLARADGPNIPNGMTELPPGVPEQPEQPGGPLHRLGKRFGVCCWASFNGYGCSSVHSELAFVFGSCRTFFGEPCLNGPPPSSVPPWAGLGGPGSHPGPYGPQGQRSSCGCD